EERHRLLLRHAALPLRHAAHRRPLHGRPPQARPARDQDLRACRHQQGDGGNGAGRGRTRRDRLPVARAHWDCPAGARRARRPRMRTLALSFVALLLAAPLFAYQADLIPASTRPELADVTGSVTIGGADGTVRAVIENVNDAA